MDDKSYSAADANTETTPVVPPDGTYTITATGTKDKDKLTGCYIVVSGSTETWYNKGGNQITSAQSSSSSLNFQHDQLKQNPSNKISWSITNLNWTTTNGVTSGTGSWSNDDDPDAAAGPQSGSFTATSSGEIDAVSASASAS